jgi:hypothetical protein
LKGHPNSGNGQRPGSGLSRYPFHDFATCISNFSGIALNPTTAGSLHCVPNFLSVKLFQRFIKKESFGGGRSLIHHDNAGAAHKLHGHNPYWRDMEKGEKLRDGNPVGFLELFCGYHPDGVPSELITNPSTNLATNAFIETNLNRRNENIVFLVEDGPYAVHRAKGDADLATSAVVFINYSHEFWFLFLASGIFSKFWYRFVVVVQFCHV